MTSRIRLIVISIIASVVLMGCSRKATSDAGSASSPVPGTNWDSMVWDQGNWS
jgi:uncharacterized protein YceK